MNPVFYAVIAVFFYGAQNVMISAKLREISPIANMLMYYIGALALTLPLFIWRKQLGLGSTLPKGNQFLFLLACVSCLIIADMFFFFAYKKGGSLAGLTITAALIPVFACIVGVFTGNGLPTRRQILGWTFAAIAVFLISGKPAEQNPGKDSGKVPSTTVTSAQK